MPSTLNITLAKIIVFSSFYIVNETKLGEACIPKITQEEAFSKHFNI